MFVPAEKYQENGTGRTAIGGGKAVSISQPPIETAPSLKSPSPPPPPPSPSVPSPKRDIPNIPSSSSRASTSLNPCLNNTSTPLRSSPQPPSNESSIPPRYCSDPLFNSLRVADIRDMSSLDGSHSPFEPDSMASASLTTMLAEQPFIHKYQLHPHKTCTQDLSTYSNKRSFKNSRVGDIQKNTGFSSPLHIAAQKGRDRIVGVLLQHRAKVNFNAAESEGRTSLTCAVIKGHKDVVVLLLANGALLSSVDHLRRSAIHWAVVHRRHSLLKLLLSHVQEEQAQAQLQSFIDSYDLNGQTALHLAIEGNFEDGVQLLLDYDANINLVARRSSVGP